MSSKFCNIPRFRAYYVLTRSGGLACGTGAPYNGRSLKISSASKPRWIYGTKANIDRLSGRKQRVKADAVRQWRGNNITWSRMRIRSE